jgi:endo-1,4-beta-D-glucanase Y
MRTTNILKLSALVLGSIVVGCGSNESSTGPGGGVGGNTSTAATGGRSGTSTTPTGGATNVGGAPVTGGVAATTGGASSATTGGASGTATGGTKATGGTQGTATGGTKGTGGTSSKVTGTGGKTGAGGTATTGGKTGAGGTATTGGNTASVGGNNTGVGGGETGGATGVGGTSAAVGGSTSQPGGDMISDFEDTPGQATMDPNPDRTGYWYVYFPGSDSATTPASGMTISPALNNGKPVVTEKDGTNNALHFKGSGYGDASSNNYAGTGAAFKPHAYPDKLIDPYDVSSFTGISFKVKAGSGTQPALFFELLTKENQPASAGGTATNQKIDLYNSRGQLLVTPWAGSNISSSWQTVTIPFGTLVPRWVPDATGCGASPSTPKCQASPFVPKDVLGIQISSYQDNGFPKVSGATAGTFDIWIDDVQFTKDDSGLQKRTGFPIANSGTWGSCIKPKGPSADAKYLVPAYNQWKATFVKNNAVIRPENANDAVSESIAYGMLIAVNMNDQALFDSLYSFWTGHIATGTLMTWCIPGVGGGGGTGSACSASGGSATDADEDAAFALLMADKAWGGSYKTKAMAMIADIWSKDIDSGTLLPKGGSNYGAPSGTGGTNITNPSYFAPAFYKAFKAAGDTHDWDGVVSAVYRSIASVTGNNGLPAAWCGSNCTVPASNGASTDTAYQYDSHRIPMRLGLDYCWYGQAEAKTFTTKNTAFFVSKATDGIGYVLDMYTPSGGAVSGTAPNSSSILGTAAVGAMATGNQAFLDLAYQSVFDTITRGNMAPVDAQGKTPYSYFNATVGMLSALMMTGNFMH